MTNEAAFVAFWLREFPGTQCPATPRELSDLSMTAQITMRATAPGLYTTMLLVNRLGKSPLTL